MNSTKQEIKQGDFVIFADSNYEVADVSNPQLVGIYDEPPSKHVDYLNRDSVKLAGASPETPKFCINCKHCAFNPPYDAHTLLCDRPKTGWHNLITGEYHPPEADKCYNQRLGECGAEAKFFEEKTK